MPETNTLRLLILARESIERPGVRPRPLRVSHPDARVSRMDSTPTWRPYHTWTPLKSTQIDGRIEFPDGTTVGLDVWAEDDEDITVDMLRGASAMWSGGGVRFVADKNLGLFSLVVPIALLTEEAVEVAIKRFCLAAFGTLDIAIEDAAEEAA